MTKQQIGRSVYFTADFLFVFSFWALSPWFLTELHINKLTPLFFFNYFVPFTEEFQRAVCISTGQTLDPYVVHTVFQLFDKDGEIFLTRCPQAGPFLYSETCIKRTPSIKRTVAEVPKLISLTFFK